MTDYSALAAQYGGTPVGDSPAVDYSALAKKYGGTSGSGDPLTPFQGAQAVATGFNRSVLAQIPGLPVKTVLDVADLARAAYGTVGRTTGFLTPDQMPAPLDRAQYFGSPEWISAQLQKTPVTSALITNPRPDIASGRILNATGGGMGAAMSGQPGILGMQGVSGASGQIASELGAPPSWSLLASMGPQAGVSGAAGTARGAFRGGEQGRQEMIDRTQQFRQAGVEPTVGLATGNRRTQVMEALLSRVPGGAGSMATKVGDIQGQMQGTANAARDLASPVYGPVAAGEALKAGVTGYRQAQQDIYGRMQDRALALVPPDMTFPVTGMLQRGGETIAAIPGAPNVTAAINKPLGITQDILGALRKDAAPQPPGTVPSPILQSSGQPFTTPTPGTPGGLPFEGIQGLKQRIGQVAYATNPLLADANTGALKNLYGGAKQDLLNAGTLADAQRIAQGQQPGVYSGLTRANTFYDRTQRILEDTLAPIYKAGESSSEGSYRSVESDLRNSGQSVTRAMAALPLDARRTTAATVIDRLGKANPGQQNAEGDAFSPQTFLTNWNKITPEAKNGILLGIPQGAQIRGKLDAIAQAADMVKKANAVYANTSGTASTAALIGTGTGIATGLTTMASGNLSHGAVILGGVLGSMAAAKGGAYLMTQPKFVNWLSQTTSLKPGQERAHVNRLAVMAGQETNPEQRQALESLVSGLRGELGITQ